MGLRFSALFFGLALVGCGSNANFATMGGLHVERRKEFTYANITPFKLEDWWTDTYLNDDGEVCGTVEHYFDNKRWFVHANPDPDYAPRFNREEGSLITRTYLADSESDARTYIARWCRLKA